MDDELLTPEEVAGYLKVKTQTLAKWRVQRDGPPYLKLGRLVRYSEAGFTAWMREAIKPGE